MGCSRIEVLRDSHWEAFHHPRHYRVVEGVLEAGGSDRLRLLKRYWMECGDPILSISATCTLEGEPVPLYAREQASTFLAKLEKESKLVECDSRVEWKMCESDGEWVVLDEHDLLRFSHPEKAIDFLGEDGFQPGQLEIPMPHRHGFHFEETELLLALRNLGLASRD
jgi:hypothetical protein